MVAGPDSAVDPDAGTEVDSIVDRIGDLAVEVRERVAELALKATDARGQPAPHEQTPAYYDQTLGGRIYLAGPSTASRPPELTAMSVPPPAVPAPA